MLILLVGPVCLAQNSSLQTDTGRLNGGLNIPSSEWGISFGNSSRFTGLRLNWSDKYLEKITGVNLTLWRPGDEPGGEITGLAVGVVGPAADRITGVSFGLAYVMTAEWSRGITIGGLATVSGGTMTGVNIGGMAVVAEDDMTGLNLSGLATISGGSMKGINYGTLATVAEGSMGLVNIGGLATVAKGRITGLSFGGLALISEDDMTGLNLGGLATVSGGEIKGVSGSMLAVVAQNSITGISIGGVAVASEGPIRGASFSLGVVTSDKEIWGISFAGYKVKSPKIRGINFTILAMEVDDFSGVAFGGYNNVRGIQTGITFGVLNVAKELRGIQIGILNYAANNPPPFRWLPVLNMQDRKSVV